jgi:hypothetical protein
VNPRADWGTMQFADIGYFLASTPKPFYFASVFEGAADVAAKRKA